MTGAASLICLAWSAVAQGQQVEPPRVVRTVDPQAVEPIAAPSPPPPDVQLPVVEPIIEDEEFEKSIPPIGAEDDPELDRPLESIADFEKRQAAAAAKGDAAGANATSCRIFVKCAMGSN